MKIKLLSFLIFLSFSSFSWAQEEISPAPEKEDLNLELEKEEKNFQFLEKTEVLTIGEGEEIFFRVAENVPYVENPKNKDFQLMNIFIPEPYFKDEKIADFSKDKAPILLVDLSENFSAQKPNEGKSPLILMALKKGFVVASVGVRGRNLKGEDNKFSGKAPSAIVDLKAAVQFLHYFDEKLAGDSKKIIAYGSDSAAGELLVLANSASNPDFANYLEELEAWGEDNSIFAAALYSPISNLEHSDAAYEWQFGGKKNIPAKTLDDGKIAASEELIAQFAEYLDSLNLTDEQESKLEVKPDGSGSFRDYLQNLIIITELLLHPMGNLITI